MPIANPKEPALWRWLGKHNSALYEHARLVREPITRWLSYVPATFPHYTSHTIDHSDEIIRNISQILFEEDSDNPAVASLTATEAYLCIMAAYLHDAGMVCSDAERDRILRSTEWSQWTKDNESARQALDGYEELRARARSDADHFAADRAIRFLLADYVRRMHPERAATLLALRDAEFFYPSLSNPGLQRAIGDVCVAHGLSLSEIDDYKRYPDERDLNGEKVSLRLCAILLRLGDLLDLRHDRACLLLMNAACPIPADSVPHWSQYTAIEHRAFSPSRIEIRAECRNPEEHRVLRDWCGWIISELDHARRVFPHARRHRSWVPPVATMGEASPTIDILPAKGARYRAVDWKFRFDHEAVLLSLVHELYASPQAFIRELLQNALDATRCQMIIDMRKAGMEPPSNPAEAPADWRERYPILVTLRKGIDGQGRATREMTISDSGIGMTEDVILNYLLQIGRSWYRSPGFRNTYGFAPASRFGLGFLSVFAVSNDVEVDTKSDVAKAIRLNIVRPQSYVLVEESSRSTRGTDVRIRLMDDAVAKPLAEYLEQTCLFVEFPVIVDDGDSVCQVRSLNLDVEGARRDFLGREISILSAAIRGSGISGRVFVGRGLHGEPRRLRGMPFLDFRRKAGLPPWDTGDDAYAYRRENLVAVSGIRVDQFMLTGGMLVAVDVRDSGVRLPAGRGRLVDGADRALVSAVDEAVVSIVRSFSDAGPTKEVQARRIQFCMEEFSLGYRLTQIDGAIPVVRAGEVEYISLDRLWKDGFVLQTGSACPEAIPAAEKECLVLDLDLVWLPQLVTFSISVADIVGLARLDKGLGVRIRARNRYDGQYIEMVPMDGVEADVLHLGDCGVAINALSPLGQALGRLRSEDGAVWRSVMSCEALGRIDYIRSGMGVSRFSGISPSTRALVEATCRDAKVKVTSVCRVQRRSIFEPAALEQLVL